MCPAPFEKIFWFSEDPNRLYTHRCPVPTEGRCATSPTRGLDAVDAGCASDESAPCGRRSRVVLTPRRRRQAGGVFSPVTVSTSRSPGRARISRKPLRGECRIASAEPVCSCALSFMHFARETAGAARTRHSPLPLIGEGGTLMANLARNMRRDREAVSAKQTGGFAVPPKGEGTVF